MIPKLILIDADMRRRAEISRDLVAGGVHVEPFEEVSELFHRWPRAGTILAHDEGTALEGLIGHMERSGSWLPVVAFAAAPSPRRVVQVIRDGVLDYISWPFDHSELADTLTAVEEAGNRLVSARLRAAMARGRLERLTAREREVLACIASGLPNGLVARQLGISTRTVEIYRASLLRKIGAKHSSEAIRVAVEASLLH